MTSMPRRSLTIAMVAGEISGDNLGAALVKEITKASPDVTFVGVGGPAMIKEGFSTEIDIETLSVNGFIDPLLRLPSLIRLLLHLRDRIVACGADCFVGIDSNFFNLLLAGMLHRRGIKTVHYVSPTVWAWRQRRIKKIARHVDLMMTLYPFETAVYEANNIPVVFVGHPKADEISPDEGRLNQVPIREQLGIAQDEVVVAILPGSRAREVDLSGRDFLATALLLRDSVTRFVIPAANRKRYEQLQIMLAEFPELDGKVTLLEGQSRQAMTASNVVLVNSGTATLEAMLLRKPMVMSYRVGKITYGIV
ncbi:MAG: lipid-A-disaccharide synthase, partial [Gammaproteobacteria bacterium]|nr:lipid-A-disaccharide synthase [Gammaproteobacteria bacterium]